MCMCVCILLNTYRHTCIHACIHTYMNIAYTKCTHIHYEDQQFWCFNVCKWKNPSTTTEQFYMNCIES